MSHLYIPAPSTRLRRCLLSSPASSAKMMAKAAISDADAVFLDLEDSVAPNAKTEARKLAVDALNTHDWRGAGKSVSVRVNGLDTPWTTEDITTLIKEAGAHIDTIIIPKVGCRADLYAADVIITQTCRDMGLDRIISMEGLIESAAGVMAINDIAGYNRYIGALRLEALHFGAGDYAATIRSPTISIGGAIPDYPGDIWHYPLSAMVAACHSNGVVPMDSAYGDFNDPDGYIEVAKRARALGMAGKWAIHPSQIALANDIFTPSADAISRAEAMIRALEESEEAGAGAVMYEGQMIDAASTRMAENIVAMARMLKQNQR